MGGVGCQAPLHGSKHIAVLVGVFVASGCFSVDGSPSRYSPFRVVHPVLNHSEAGRIEESLQGHGCESLLSNAACSPVQCRSMSGPQVLNASLKAVHWSQRPWVLGGRNFSWRCQLERKTKDSPKID